MRASTLFALTVAVLIGLGVAVAARMSGYFNPAPKDAPVTQVKKPEILILVASRNLFAGDLINSADVRVRPLKAEEAEHEARRGDRELLVPLHGEAAPFLRALALPLALVDLRFAVADGGLAGAPPGVVVLGQRPLEGAGVGAGHLGGGQEAARK